MNWDKLNFMDSDKAAQAAFSVIDAVQKLPEEYRILGLSSCFILMCERFNVKPADVMRHAEKVMRLNEDTRYWNRQFTAIAEYLEKEIRPL